jgi:hypothetical protein
MVRTGDQALPRVSRQMAPWIRLLARCMTGRKFGREMYSLGADIWMPEFRDEFHDGRFEGVVIWDLNIDDVCAALIWCVSRSGEGSS